MTTPSKRSNALPILLLLAAILAGLLFFWTREAEISPFEHVPAEGAQLLVIPSAERLGRELASLSEMSIVTDTLALVGQPSPDEFFQGIAQLIGADVRDPNALTAIGLAPDRPTIAFGAKVFRPRGHERLVLALPVANKTAIEAWLNTQALAKLGAKPTSERLVGKHTARVFSNEQDARVVLFALIHGRYLYLAQDAALLEQAFALPFDKSLARDADFLALQASLDRPALWARVGFEKWMIGVGLDLTPQRLGLHLRLPLSALERLTAGARDPAALANLLKSAPLDITGRLDPGAQILAQTGIDPARLVALRPKSGGLLARMTGGLLKLVGLDIDQLAAEIEPGVAASLRLAPNAELMSLLLPGALRRTNPFDVAHIEIVAQVKEESRARALLDRLATLAPIAGGSAQRYTKEGAPIVDPTGAARAGADPLAALQAFASAAGITMKAGTPNPDTMAARWRFDFRSMKGLTVELSGKRLFVSGGEGVGESLAMRQPAAQAPHALDAAGLVLHADLGAFIASLRALPAASFGIGGDTIKATLDRWLGAFDALDTLRLTASQGEALLELDASLSLKRPTTAEAAP
ncbi:MAG: hypothetical protein LBM75_06070 [Myxococcales bacterium]|jgi:hypothetical protein|nr:hypothetical protein [Myxococcales bacterium]